MFSGPAEKLSSIRSSIGFSSFFFNFLLARALSAISYVQIVLLCRTRAAVRSFEWIRA